MVTDHGASGHRIGLFALHSIASTGQVPGSVPPGLKFLSNRTVPLYLELKHQEQIKQQ